MTALRKNTLCAAALCALMFIAAGASVALKPTALLADRLPPIDLEAQIPRAFGNWRVDDRMSVRVINPQAETLVNKLYSQVLTRTYVDSTTGERIMLSIAYGSNQSGSLQVHIPDVCYPAQGFEVLDNSMSSIVAGQRTLPVKRLLTRMGTRVEPLTYWRTVGDAVVMSGREHRLALLRYGMRLEIPDGLIFRASSINIQADAAWSAQQKFVADLLVGVSSSTRLRLTGE